MDIYTHIYFECGDEASWVTKWPEKWSEHGPYPLLEKAVNAFPADIWQLKEDLAGDNKWNAAMPEDEEMKVGIIDFVTKLYACSALLMDCFETELDIYAELVNNPNKLYGLDVYVCNKHSTEKWKKNLHSHPF